MKLDKYIKLTDEDVETLKHIISDEFDFTLFGLSQHHELLRKLAKQVVVVKPAGEED